MSATTTRRKSKAFSFSYSKLKDFETCPKRYYHQHVAKDIKEPDSEALLWGNQVHEALAKRIQNNTPLPVGMDEYEPWAVKVLAGPGKIFVEQKLAIREDFSPCEFFDNQAWFRAIGDVIKVNGSVALILDWKTGKIVEDSVQLALCAACVFAHHPQVKRVRSKFVWLKEDADTVEDFTREGMVEIWAHLWPRIMKLKEANDAQTYPPKPNHLCKKWCPVTSCPHHGG